MKIALIIIALILLIFAVLLFVPFFFVIEFSKKEDKKNFDVKVKYLFFNIKTKEKKNEKPDETVKEKDNTTLTEKVKNGIEIFKENEDDVVDILHYASEKAVKIRNLTFCMDFGLSDPMDTGISTGAINGIIYNVLALLNNFFEIEECNVKINPDFERKHMDISSRCILKIKSVHIIIIVFKVLKMYFKITKIKKGSF